MSRHRNFNELLSKMSPERRARVKAEADDLHREYVLSQSRAVRYHVRQRPPVFFSRHIVIPRDIMLLLLAK